MSRAPSSLNRLLGGRHRRLPVQARLPHETKDAGGAGAVRAREAVHEHAALGRERRVLVLVVGLRRRRGPPQHALVALLLVRRRVHVDVVEDGVALL